MEENNEQVSEQPVEVSQSNKMLPIAGIAIVVLILGGVALASRGSSQPTQTENKIQPTTAPDTGSEAEVQGVIDESVQIVAVEAGSYYYKPNEIRVKKGQTVKIVLTAVDRMHDFNIDELEVKLPVVQSGNTGEVEFTPGEVGEFEYYCSVGQHRKQGQVGKLIVEE